MKNFFKIPAGKVLRIIGFFAIGMVGGIFAEQFAWPYFVEKPLFDRYNFQQPVYITERKEIYIQENVALESAIEKAEKTIISIKTKTAQGKTIEGSGLVLTSDGLVITLADLVPQGSTFYFYSEGAPVNHQILKRDSKLNLALVKIEKNNLSTVSFGNLDGAKLGKRIFIVGSVFATNTPEKMANEGIIQRIGDGFIKINITQKEGVKGSGIFDIEGNVLGINDLDSSGGIVSIPIAKIKNFTGF